MKMKRSDTVLQKWKETQGNHYGKPNPWTTEHLDNKMTENVVTNQDEKNVLKETTEVGVWISLAD